MSCEKELAEKQAIIDRLTAENARLKQDLSDMISGSYWEQPWNERNAGRKTIVTKKLISSVHKLINEQWTMRAISKELNISLGLVSKISNMVVKEDV